MKQREFGTSILTLRTYRVTEAGERIDLAQREIRLLVPCQIELVATWPACACPRCRATPGSQAQPSLN